MEFELCTVRGFVLAFRLQVCLFVPVLPSCVCRQIVTELVTKHSVRTHSQYRVSLSLFCKVRHDAFRRCDSLLGW